MARKVPKWLKITGFVCGVALLLSAGAAIGSFFFVRSSFRQFQAADRSFDAVAEQHGTISSYRPDPDGVIRTERLEAFLAARERVQDRRSRIEHALNLLSSNESNLPGALPRLRGSVGLMRNLGAFHRERNEALIDSGLGLGEYYYLYTLVYYSWLGRSPADGPTFQVVGENGFLLETLEPMDEPAVRDFREEQARLSLNRLLLPVLRNQLEDLRKQQRPDSSEFQSVLASEIAALEIDSRRIPWEDGLPDVVERSLDSYRDRLGVHYSPMCNAIEIGLARRTPQLANGEAQAHAPDA